MGNDSADFFVVNQHDRAPVTWSIHGPINTTIQFNQTNGTNLKRDLSSGEKGEVVIGVILLIILIGGLCREYQRRNTYKRFMERLWASHGLSHHLQSIEPPQVLESPEQGEEPGINGNRHMSAETRTPEIDGTPLCELKGTKSVIELDGNPFADEGIDFSCGSASQERKKGRARQMKEMSKVRV